MGKGKVTKKEELRAALNESLIKDKDSIVKIRSHMREICNLCKVENVEPETLLFEVNIIKTLSEFMLQKKLMITARKNMQEITSKKERLVKKEFFRFCDVIEVKGHEAFFSITRNDDVPEKDEMKERSIDVPNEMQAYVPIKERPNYIH